MRSDRFLILNLKLIKYIYLSQGSRTRCLSLLMAALVHVPHLSEKSSCSCSLHERILRDAPPITDTAICSRIGQVDSQQVSRYTHACKHSTLYHRQPKASQPQAQAGQQLAEIVAVLLLSAPNHSKGLTQTLGSCSYWERAANVRSIDAVI